MDIKDLEVEEENTKFRSFKGHLKIIVFILAIAFSIFQLTIIYYPVNTVQLRIIHLMFGLVLIFTLVPAIKSKKTSPITISVDLALITLSLISCFYIAKESVQLSSERLGYYNSFDIFASIVLLILVIEATRRILGWALPIISILFILYALFGFLIPGRLGNAGFSFERISTSVSLWTEGILGTPLGVSASYVTLFVIFAVFLQRTGAGQFFIDLALSVFGRFRGGPAKVAVIASSLFGSISGSAVANVAGTGTLTIPLMKRNGFSKYDAAGVEAVSSSGGQLMPPIMGASAFIMAEILGLPYSMIILAALIPAILYYTSVFISVDFKAIKMGLKGIPKSQLPSFRKTFKKGWHLSTPLIILIYLLAFEGTSPGKAAFWAIVSSVLVTMFRKNTRMSLKEILSALQKGAYSALEIVAVCACAGIVIGIFTLTGLGLKFSGIIIEFSQGSLILLLILTMIACLIAGMGVPTVAAYLIVAVLVAPALVRIGIQPIAAHLFVFYFAIISAITPPVALASYVAAGISGSNPFKTSIKAFKLGLAAFIIPFMFVYNPTLIFEGQPIEILVGFTTAIFGVTLLSGSLEGYYYFFGIIKKWLRVVLFVASITLIHPNVYTDLVGAAFLLIFAIVVMVKRKISSNNQDFNGTDSGFTK
ncbi:TRAP transporter 4TM/12TM fusion protein [Salirhabdus euzebyi]|uniref:TRAP transporter 4TM/12TM fusion protein n=1 Tax=Salirhabdus euzebyi TaxID=394506 RepID=A0A841Q8C0_9BACI|nr:TRAP transporter permease [Salirhabdus euzebyi]MBB6454573.1 TRAP transporter 4TM/12TM fusion protein [Salirhabdus euzebyi]